MRNLTEGVRYVGLYRVSLAVASCTLAPGVQEVLDSSQEGINVISMQGTTPFMMPSRIIFPLRMRAFSACSKLLEWMCIPEQDFSVSPIGSGCIGLTDSV